MRRLMLIGIILLALLFAGLLAFGIGHGDARFVAENAKAFCFS